MLIHIFGLSKYVLRSELGNDLKMADTDNISELRERKKVIDKLYHQLNQGEIEFI